MKSRKTFGKVWKTIGGIVFMLLGVGSACNRVPTYRERVSGQLKEIFSTEQLSRYRYIVFVPNGGCSGCLQEAENYYLQSRDDSLTLFVFTNFLSRKDLRIKLGDDVTERRNVWLDDEKCLYFSTYQESLYPCVIFLSEGRIGRFANLDELLP